MYIYTYICMYYKTNPILVGTIGKRRLHGLLLLSGFIWGHGTNSWLHSKLSIGSIIHTRQKFNGCLAKSPLNFSMSNHNLEFYVNIIIYRSCYVHIFDFTVIGTSGEWNCLPCYWAERSVFSRISLALVDVVVSATSLVNCGPFYQHGFTEINWSASGRCGNNSKSIIFKRIYTR